MKWSNDAAEMRLIEEIVERYNVLRAKRGLEPADRVTLMMDINACHSNAFRLDLPGLLKAKHFDFVHDVQGISKYLDRNTGTLKNLFIPRYSQVGQTLRRNNKTSRVSNAHT